MFVSEKRQGEVHIEPKPTDREIIDKAIFLLEAGFWCKGFLRMRAIHGGLARCAMGALWDAAIMLGIPNEDIYRNQSNFDWAAILNIPGCSMGIAEFNDRGSTNKEAVIKMLHQLKEVM